MNPLRSYRDDGPLAEVLRRARLAPAVLGALLAAAAVAIGALIGRASPSTGLVAGVAVIAVLVGGLTGGGAESRFDWLEPAGIRGAEYGFLLWLGAATPHGLPAAYALMAALAFHHYDTVYRLRHLQTPPPVWLAVAGGWDGRLLVAALAFALHIVRPLFFVAAAVLGVVFVTESVRTWVRASRPAAPALTPGDRPA